MASPKTKKVLSELSRKDENKVKCIIVEDLVDNFSVIAELKPLLLTTLPRFIYLFIYLITLQHTYTE